ncbi:hypothetical protein ACFVYJ_10255 [Pontibacter sp. JAM-7]|uniref:hypothetical protein n=1 Tax=Pontibacter sp. JAM-7 TaxID=3366581 RepID=UPI003AF48674
MKELLPSTEHQAEDEESGTVVAAQFRPVAGRHLRRTNHKKSNPSEVFIVLWDELDSVHPHDHF